MERVKGIEPSSSAWKDFALSVRLLPLVDNRLACMLTATCPACHLLAPLPRRSFFPRTISKRHCSAGSVGSDFEVLKASWDTEIGSAPRHCRHARKDDGGRIAFSLRHSLGPRSLCGGICGKGPPFPHNPLNLFAQWRKRLSSASAGARAILCTGIIVLDEIFQVERFPQPETKTPAHGFFAVNGGCAANAAVAVARLGARAALAGPLGGPAGEDANGDRVLAALAREQVDCAGCRRVDGLSTPLSAILVDAQGERMIVTHRDRRLDAARPADAAALVASADAVLADNRFPEFVRPICAAARTRGIKVVLDVDGPTPMGDDLFRIATHVVFSHEGLSATTGLDDPGAALARIADTTQSFLAVTRGPQDVLWRDGPTLRNSPVFP